MVSQTAKQKIAISPVPEAQSSQVITVPCNCYSFSSHAVLLTIQTETRLKPC